MEVRESCRLGETRESVLGNGAWKLEGGRGEGVMSVVRVFLPESTARSVACPGSPCQDEPAALSEVQSHQGGQVRRGDLLQSSWLATEGSCSRMYLHVHVPPCTYTHVPVHS